MPLGTVVTCARVCLAIVLLVAGIPKFAVGKGISDSVRSLGVEGPRLVFALRLAVPMVETALGVWLLLGTHPVVASFTAAAMFAAFSYALIQLRSHGASSCGCFIWEDGRVDAGHLIRDLVFVADAAVIGVVTLTGRYDWEPVWRLPMQSALVVAASVFFVFLAYLLIASTLQLARGGVTDEWSRADGR